MLLARISLTLSRHFSLSFVASGRSSGYIPYSHIAAECMFELFVLLLPAICGGPKEYITYELVPASPAVSCHKAPTIRPPASHHENYPS